MRGDAAGWVLCWCCAHGLPCFRGLTVARQGSNHEVYSLGGLMIPIGRATEFGNKYAEMVWEECEPKLGEDWWR